MSLIRLKKKDSKKKIPNCTDKSIERKEKRKKFSSNSFQTSKIRFLVTRAFIYRQIAAFRCCERFVARVQST